jgi:hypothetical protein
MKISQQGQIGRPGGRESVGLKAGKQKHELERTPGKWGELGADATTAHRIEDVNKHCLAEFRKHWQCLDNNNQQLWQCRPQEWKLNKCVFDNLVRPTRFQNITMQLLIPVR